MIVIEGTQMNILTLRYHRFIGYYLLIDGNVWRLLGDFIDKFFVPRWTFYESFEILLSNNVKNREEILCGRRDKERGRCKAIEI